MPANATETSAGATDAERVGRLERYEHALEAIARDYHWADSPAGRIAREALGWPCSDSKPRGEGG